MIPPDDDTTDTADRPPAGAGAVDEDTDDAATGLPWLGSWAGVYALVVGCFVAYVVLLVALKQAFS
jgi:hypothetical protein